MKEELIKPEYEYIVAGNLLLNPNIVGQLTEDCFLVPECQTIFKRVLELHKKGEPVNPLVIFANTDIPKEKQDEMIRSVAKNPQMYIDYIKDFSARYRLLNDVADNINGDVNTIVKRYVASISEVKTKENINPIDEMLSILDNKIKNKGIDGICSGLPTLDYMLNGFCRKCFYVVAGRSGMGKSAFMTSFIANTNKKVGVLSLEMTAVEVFRRIACIRSNVDYSKVWRGNLNDDELSAFIANSKIKNVIVDDRGGLDLFKMELAVTDLKNKGCEVIFIDHLGLVRTDGKGNKADEMGKITARIKELAKRYDIPIIALCQLNREVDKKEVKKPSIENLRDSGRIEEDTDGVVLLYRPSLYYDKEREYNDIVRCDNEAQIIVAKNRNGSCGTVKACFDKFLMKYYC